MVNYLNTERPYGTNRYDWLFETNRPFQTYYGEYGPINYEQGINPRELYKAGVRNINLVDDIKLPEGMLYRQQYSSPRIQGIGSVKPGGLPSSSMARYGGRQYITPELIEQISNYATKSPTLTGNVTKNVDTAKEIEKLYRPNGYKQISNVGKGLASSIKYMNPKAKLMPVTGDIWDIYSGGKKIIDSSGVGGKALGAGQLALGLAGLLTLPFTGGAGSAGKAGLKAISKQIVKSLGKQRLRQLGAKTAGSKAVKSGSEELANRLLENEGMREIIKAVKNMSKASDTIHSPLRRWFEIPDAINELLLNTGATNTTDQEQSDNVAEASKEVENNSDKYKPINPDDVMAGLFDTSQTADASTPTDVPTEGLRYEDGVVPNKPFDEFIRNRVDTFGLNVGDTPHTNSDGYPTNLAGVASALRNNGYDSSKIAGILNGLNYGNKDIDDSIKYYNSIAEPGQKINIPQTQKEVDAINNILTGAVDNSDNQPVSDYDPEYINNIINTYDTLRSYKKPYIDQLQNLADNYGQKWLLDFSLKQAGAPIGDIPTVTDMMADRADVYNKLAGEQSQYDTAILEALGNYKLANELGLPLGSEFADKDLRKLLAERSNKNTEQTYKLITELMKLSSTNEQKELDRKNRYDIASMQVKAQNERARLTRELQVKQLQLRRAQIEGNIRLQIALRNSINDINKRINAANIVGNAGVYGVENPQAVVDAMKVLGIDLDTSTFNSDSDIGESFENAEKE